MKIHVKLFDIRLFSSAGL